MRVCSCLLAAVASLGLTAGAEGAMLIPPTRVGSSDWGSNESVHQLFDWANPVLGQRDPGYPDWGCWDSGGEFNMTAWMDFGSVKTFTALDFATQPNNDGFNRVKLWISDSLSGYADGGLPWNAATSPAGTPDLNVTCGANGTNFAQYPLSAPITSRYVVAQFFSERITNTSIFHPRAWELRMEGTDLGAGNDSQILITSLPDTASTATGASTRLIALGRVLTSAGGATTAAQTLGKTGISATTYTVTTAGDISATGFANGSLPGGVQSVAGTITLDTTAAGSKSGTVTVANTAADSAAAGLGSQDANDVFTVTATALAPRVVTADSVSLGLQHAGADLSGSPFSSMLRTSGDDNHATRVTVNGTLFDAAGVTSAITPAGPASVAASGTMTTTYAVVTAENGGAGLSGEGSYAAVTVPYTALAFSGTATYTGASGGNWSAHANWTDGSGVHGAPGTFAGFDNDTALVDGEKTVVMDAPLTLGNVTVSSTAKVALGGSSSVNLGNAVKLADLNLNAHATSGLTATADLNKSKLIVDKTQVPLATVRAQIKSAYASGRWSAAGVTSGAAAADYAANAGGAKTGVGYLDNALPSAQGGSKSTWQGRSVDSNSVLVRFTYYGDANLDGSVNLADFGLLKQNFGTGTQWYQGDFDYSGTVNLADFGKLKQAFGAPPLTAAAAVPEPSLMALLLTGGLAVGLRLLRRRRR